MRTAAVAALTGLVLSGCGAQPHRTPDPVPAGSPAGSASGPVLPDVALASLDGGPPVTLATLRGTPTVINLWASWCAPCRAELPLLARAHREFGDRMRIIGVDFADDSPDSAMQLAARSGVTYRLLADPKSSVKNDLEVIGLPQTVFVDAQGTIVSTERRPLRSYDELTTAITKHLGVKP